MRNGRKLNWLILPGMLLVAGLSLVCLLPAQSVDAPADSDTVYAVPQDAPDAGRGGERARHRAERRAERRQMLQFRVLERIAQMTPEERERTLSRLPEGRRKRVVQGLRRLEAMTPEQRQQLTNRLRRFGQMTPERQQRLRDLTRELAALPPARRNSLRIEFQRLQRMPEAQQLERAESTEFQNHFSESERRLLLNLMENAPPMPPRGRPGPTPRR